MKSKLYTRFAMVFMTILMFTFIAKSQTTISVQILAPTDDAEEYASAVGGETPGAVYNTSSDLELVFDSEVQYVGLIFRGVAIPTGSTITNAYVQFQVDAISPGTTDAAVTLDIYGAKEATIPAGGFDEAVPFGISSHPATTARVSWSPGASVAEGDKGVNEQTADIKTIIQEIIGITGWASGNDLMVVIMWTGSVDQADNINREMEAADGDALAAPTLFVTYTSGPVGVNPATEFSNSIYPNPTQGILSIENPSTDKFSYEIYTINGKLVASRNNVAGPTTQVDLSSFAKGVYFVNVQNSETTETHKLILK